MTFRRRSYPEVLNHLLTGILGGVTAEAHPYPPSGASAAPYAHALQKTPVQQILAVYGTRNGQSYEFIRDTDYALADDGQRLTWIEGGQTPDAGTVVDVDYMPQGIESVVTDLQIGSVLRTLAESIGLEIARMYAQMEGVYRSGFIDTATDKALDHVVALLDLTRINAGRFTAQVAFSRTPGSHGEIHIPAGTRILTDDGKLEYATTAGITLLEGQSSAKVVARDVEENSQGADAATLTVLAKPIAGIAAVTNEIPASQPNTDETDAELRTRAKSFLHGSERATLGAIQEAVTRQGVKAEVKEETTADGMLTVKVKVHGALENDLSQRINTAIYEVRPAGVPVELEAQGAPLAVALTLRVTTSGDLLESDLRAAHEQVKQILADYFTDLPANDPGSVNRVIGLVLSVPEIEDVEIVSSSPPATDGRFGLADQTTELGSLEIVDPNLPTLLQVVVTVPEGAALPDPSALTTALGTAVDGINVENERLVPENDAFRTVTFNKLLYLLPLHPEDEASEFPGSVQDLFSDDVTLPPDSYADPYTISFTFNRQSGLSQILWAGSEPYLLEAFERLQLTNLEVQVEAPDA